MIRGILAVVGLGIIASPLAALAQTGFQGFAIGQDLADAKSTGLPASEYSARKIRCTDDSEKPRYLSVTAEEAELGVVRCWPTEQVGSSLVRSSLPVGGSASATVELLFQSGKLVRILTVYDSVHARALGDGLTLKFGKPASRSVGKVQNRMGAEFEQAETIWKTPDATVAMRAPDLTLERMTVVYYSPAGAALEAKLNAREAAGLNL